MSELNSFRNSQKIIKEEYARINAQLQELVSDNYQTLLNTSESVINLSKISHYLNDQIKMVSDTMHTLRPIEEVKEEVKKFNMRSVKCGGGNEKVWDFFPILFLKIYIPS